MRLSDLTPRTVNLCHDKPARRVANGRTPEGLKVWREGIARWQRENRERINARRRLTRPSRAKA